MKNLIRKYIRVKVYAITSLRREIREIQKCVRQLYEITAGQTVLIEEYMDKSYKTKLKEEHKKYKQLEKESREIIEELTETIKRYEKEMRK